MPPVDQNNSPQGQFVQPSPKNPSRTVILTTGLVVVFVLIAGGFFYVTQHSQKPGLVPVNQNSVKKITSDFIPLAITGNSESFYVTVLARFTEKKSQTVSKEIPFRVDVNSWRAPALYLTPDMVDGIYDLEVLGLKDTGDYVSIYKSEVHIDKKIVDGGLVTIEQTYPPRKDSWDGVATEPFVVDKEIRFLQFKISNNSNSQLRVRAFEMGTEAGGIVGFAKTLSVYNASNGQKLSLLSDLFQTSQTVVDYNIYYLDNPIVIGAGESADLELRAAVTRGSPPGFFVHQLFGETDQGVVRKDVYMTPRARIN
jgi:hypothetical protein